MSKNGEGVRQGKMDRRILYGKNIIKKFGDSEVLHGINVGISEGDFTVVMMVNIQLFLMIIVVIMIWKDIQQL